MIALDVSTILGNKTKPWFSVCYLNVLRDKAASFFGVPPVVADEPDLGTADYWAVQFDCGLRLGFEFFHCSEGGSVLADVPCVQHVRRHLCHWQHDLVDYPPETFAPDREAMVERFSSEIPLLRELDAFQVWRQGDDGNQVKVGVPTTKRDAECWVAELESHRHKQIYWVSRCVNRPNWRRIPNTRPAPSAAIIAGLQPSRSRRDSMPNNSPRYDGKPLLRLLELWVQWAIDEIDPQDLTRLEAMEPNLQNTWKLDGTWHDMIETLLELQPSVRNELRAMWQRNLDTAKQHGDAPPVELFSQSIADQLIGSD